MPFPDLARSTRFKFRICKTLGHSVPKLQKVQELTMSQEFFPGIPKIAFGGPKSRNPLEFKHYNADELVGGKTMRDH